jgi:SnoaL-like domain
MSSAPEQLTGRLRRLEDIFAVHELIAGYGLTIDGGLPTEGGTLWTEDCVYDSDGAADGGYRTRAGIESLIAAARGADLGFAHITELPTVVVEGDRATAHAPSNLPIRRDDGRFRISRVSANRWDLVRAESGWQIQQRTSRVLDGSVEAKRLYAEGARMVGEERASLVSPARDETNSEDKEVKDEEFIALSRRVAELEDKFAILQLVAAYGPTIDGGAAKEAGLLWTDDCWYDSDASSAGTDGVRGRAAIEEVSARCGEAQFGIAHISHMPLIKVEGDRAIVIDHSNTFHQEGSEFAIGRVSSNRWDLVRVDGKWQVERRVNRLLDGSASSRSVFTDGVQQILGS